MKCPLKFVIYLTSAAIISIAGASHAGADSTEPGDASAVRERLLMDFGWRFAFGHATDPVKDFDPSPAGTTFNYFTKAGNGLGAAAASFNDGGWRKLDLPHDWAVELPFDRNGNGSHGYKAIGRNFPATSVGWYRKKFEIPVSDLGRRITIEFQSRLETSTPALKSTIAV